MPRVAKKPGPKSEQRSVPQYVPTPFVDPTLQMVQILSKESFVPKTPVYDDDLRLECVALMQRPDGPSANELSHQIGISQPTLSRWLREAEPVKPPKRAPRTPARAKPQQKQAAAPKKTRKSPAPVPLTPGRDPGVIPGAAPSPQLSLPFSHGAGVAEGNILVLTPVVIPANLLPFATFPSAAKKK